ncbi:MAG: ATP synthase F1 subunit epsilon [Myxococcota bacterium]|jgi:F-type H+-transporting ATPase subunit epsilon|nr:ATP synthase F1 subunit epsilon [Myxococcota bacterium]
MSLDLIVVTPQGEVFAEAVEQVVLPGAEGDFGVLENHEKFLTALKPGPVEIRLPGGTIEWAAISDGFAQVTANQVVVLVDECFKAHEIDLEHAQHTHAEAESELAELMNQLNSEDTRAEVESTLVRASVMIETHSRHHS